MTRRIALLGKPLRRRHSVVMHNAAFVASGIDARYVLMEIDEEFVAAAVGDARACNEWLGLGVTAPYKKLVASLVDEVEHDAREIGAVNNVVREPDGRLIGFNTDAPGFRVGAELALGRPLTGANVVVAGAGGVARAIVYACQAAGVAGVTVGNRTLPAAIGGVEAVGLDSPEFAGALASADLAVNATTVGMINAGATMDVWQMRDDATVFDCVYVPAETPLLAAARERGLKFANGSEMLIAQAAIAFERWTGVSGMSDIMREAVEPLIADPAAVA
ncbi:MAG: shikimate dehydrogenase [Candidatus Limnocylindrales bacterium]